VSGFLLDTNVPSELVRTQPSQKVTVWIAAQDLGSLFVSVVSFGEWRKGMTIMEPGRRRTELEAWIEEELAKTFAGRILPVTQNIAERWGILEGQRQRMGRPLNVPDGQIAATALEHGLTMVTRNTEDFDHLGLTIINPWASG
jgi:predicted nucleic acid-binding protein